MSEPVRLVWQSPNAVILKQSFSLDVPNDAKPPEKPIRQPASVSVSYDRPIRHDYTGPDSLMGESLLRGTLSLGVELSASLTKAEASPAESKPASDLVWGQIKASFEPVGADLYGGGELAGALRINGRKFTCWNTDAFYYTDENKSLYQSHCWVMVLLDDGSTAGLFIDTSYRCDVDLSEEGQASFSVPLGDPSLLHPAHRHKWTVDTYRILAVHPADCANGLARLTGHMPLPPRWALGFQQCRWSYNSHKEALQVAKQFRDRNIPCDVMWFDIDYMDRYRVFTFDEEQFPDPRQTNTELHNLGFKSVWMLDPGVACGDDKETPFKPSGAPPTPLPAAAVADDATSSTADTSTLPPPPIATATSSPSLDQQTQQQQQQQQTDVLASDLPPPPAGLPPALAAKPNLTVGVYTSGMKGDHFVRKSETDSTPWTGNVWPGPCHFPDFARKATRDWWAQQFIRLVNLGVDGVWNDMNEIAVFNTPTKTMDLDAWHRTDKGTGFPHAFFHNIYGTMMTSATFQGLKKAAPRKRPFVLTRAGCVGSQRYAATWTGDNASDPRHLRWSVPMALRLGLSGQPFVGPDIGGFFGDASPRLFARWCALGAMLPLARAHSAKHTAPHEPWAFGEECEATCRVAIARRYRLLPTLYTAFREAHRSGLPVIRPLFYADPCDPVLRDADSGFLLGDDVLVATPRHYFSDTLLSEEERSEMVKKAKEAKKAAENEPKEFDLPEEHLSAHPNKPFSIIPPQIDPESLRDAHGTPLPGGADQWMLLDDAVDDGIDMTGASVADLPLLYARRGSCVALGPAVQSTSELDNNESVVDVVVALAAEPGAMAIGVVYEDTGDGYLHQKAGEYRETTYHAAVLDSLDHVVVQRRVTGGGAGFGPFPRVRILCSVGSRQTAVGIIQPSDDTLELYLPPMGIEGELDDQLPPLSPSVVVEQLDDDDEDEANEQGQFVDGVVDVDGEPVMIEEISD